MNNKSKLPTLLIFLFITSFILSQEYDSLVVKSDMFWGAKYSVYGTSYKLVFNPFQGGHYTNNFIELFSVDSKETEYLIKAENKNILLSKYIAPLAGGFLGLAIANHVQTKPLWDKNNDLSLFLAGSFFGGIGAFVQTRGFEYLKKAVELRNKRIEIELRKLNE
jgi:hypothetical protein